MKLWMKILIGIFLGTIVGGILGENSIYLKPLGTIFLNLVNMVIVLLILASMTLGISSIHDPKKLGRLGGKTVGIYLMTTCLAMAMGILFALIGDVGGNVALVRSAVSEVRSVNLGEMLLSIVPSNPIAAMAQGNILQVIIFSVFLGLAINFSGAKGKPLLSVLESLADVMYRLTSIVMAFAPIGVFGIMAWAIGTMGITLLMPLLKFLLIYYAACIIHFFVVYGTMLRGFGRLKLAPFFRGMRDATVMAFSTGSSAVTLPVAMHCAQENLGVSKNISSFVFPLGISLNMNGTAIYQVMGAIFVAHAYGIILDIPDYFKLALTVLLSAIGTAGLPGAGFIMLTTVLSVLGLPLEGLAILASIDRIRDMATTVLNILGDAAVTVFIAKQEQELDERRYHHADWVALGEEGRVEV